MKTYALLAIAATLLTGCVQTESVEVAALKEQVVLQDTVIQGYRDYAKASDEALIERNRVIKQYKEMIDLQDKAIAEAIKELEKGNNCTFGEPLPSQKSNRKST